MVDIIQTMNEGMLKQNGVHLESHEYHTVRLLLDNGFDIELIPPSQIKGLHIGDFIMQGVLWELKSPTGNGKNTIKHTIQNATHQSNNIIVDLYRCRLDETHAINELKQHFQLSKRLRRMKVITKSEKILDFNK